MEAQSSDTEVHARNNLSEKNDDALKEGHEVEINNASADSQDSIGDKSESTVEKQQKDLQDYRRKHHKKWRRSKSMAKDIVSEIFGERSASRNEPALAQKDEANMDTGTDKSKKDISPSHKKWRKSKSLAKEVVSEVSRDNSTYRDDSSVAQNDDVNADADTDESPQKDPSSKHRRKKRRNKRHRQLSEGDFANHKRRSKSPHHTNVLQPCPSPEIIEIDTCSPPTKAQSKHEEKNKDKCTPMQVDSKVSHKKSKSDKPSKDCPSTICTTQVKQVGLTVEPDEEIMCLGSFSRQDAGDLVDLTESPPATAQKGLESMTLSQNKSDNPENNKRGQAEHSTPNPSHTLSSANNTVPVLIGGPSTQPEWILSPGFGGNPVPYLNPFTSQPHVLGSTSGSFSNFMAAAAFGNALLPLTNTDHIQNPGPVNVQVPQRRLEDMDSSEFSSPVSRHQKSSKTHKKEFHLRHRAWSPVFDPDRTQTTIDFTIMSYNVLSQNLLHDNSYLYGGCPKNCTNWEYRSQNLLNEICFYMPDIVSLQEVFAEHFFDFFEPKLKEKGYQGCYKCRTRAMKDGCATFFKTSKFSLINETPIEYYNPSVPVLDRDNIALVLTLEPREIQTDVKLIVSNTHLLFNPRRGDVKLAQLMVLLAKVDQLARIVSEQYNPAEPKYHPVIMTGDLNCEPNSPIYQFLATGKVEYAHHLISDFSGQEEGMRYGGRSCFTNEVIPSTVGITDNCQYKKDVYSMIKTWANHQKQLDAKKRNVPSAGTSSSQETVPTVIDIDVATLENKLGKQCSGKLATFLPLVSVYRHRNFCSSRKKYENEVTTHHGRANCTVDYIFYTVESRTTKIKHERVKLRWMQEGKLRLTKRLALPNDKDMERIGSLPNRDVSSDHISLLAEFQLKLS